MNTGEAVTQPGVLFAPQAGTGENAIGTGQDGSEAPDAVLQAYRQRVAVEEPYELRRHAVPLRMTLLAAYCLLRGRELTDILVDLLLELIHRLGAKADRSSYSSISSATITTWQSQVSTGAGASSSERRPTACSLNALRDR